MHYITLHSHHEEDHELAHFDKLLVKFFHDRNRWSIKYISLPVFPEFLERIELPRENFVIFGKNLETVTHTITHLLRIPFWHPDGSYILMVLNPVNRKELKEKILDFMLYLWRQRVTKTILIITDDPSRENYKIFKWLPYANGRCGNDQNEITFVGLCNNETKTFQIFENRVPKNLNNCPVRIITHMWPVHVFPMDVNRQELEGIEINLLKTIARQANIRLEFKIFDEEEAWGQVLPDKTTTGMLNVLTREEADLAIGGYWPSRSRLAMFDMSSHYFYDEIKFVIHTAKFAQKWKSLTTIFEMDTWIMLVSAYIFITLTMHFIVLHTRKMSYTNKAITMTAMNLWGPIFMAPVNFAIRRFKLRIFFIMWVFSNFFLNASYQTSLTSVLVNPSFEHQISTLNELVNADYNFMLNTPVLGFLETWDGDIFNTMLKRSTKCVPTLNCLLKVAERTDYATLIPKSYFVYESWRFKDKHRRSIMYVFPRKLMFYISVMYMTKGYPLKSRINELIVRTTEAGLVRRWLQNIYLKKKLYDHIEEDEDPEPLTTQHLYGIFMIAVIGWTVGVIFLLGEFMYKKKKNIKQSIMNLIKRIF